MKNRMKEKHGFTLVEVLAVITILGLIALIIVPTVERTIKDSKSDMYEKQQQSILTALQEWTIDNKDAFYDTDVVTLTLGDLKALNYVDYDIKNPNSNKCLSNSMSLRVTKKDNKKYVYEIVGSRLVDGTDADCEIPE